MRNRLALLVAPALLAGIVAGGPATRPTTRTTEPDTRPATRPATWQFLGLDDDQERNAASGFTVLTKTQSVDYNGYLERVKKEEVKEQEVHSGFVYFAVHEGVCVQPAYYLVVKRFKAAIPGAAKSQRPS